MNNELSFESIFNLGVGNKSLEVNSTSSLLSEERFDGFMDSNELDYQNSIESINFINDYERVNDYNNILKIKMLNKINKEYGKLNRGIENYIYSLEEEVDGTSAKKEESESTNTEQPSGTSEKKLKWYQKVWESVKKVAIAIWRAIVKVFKTILKIITFGHYGKNKKEKVDELKKKTEEVKSNPTPQNVKEVARIANNIAPNIPEVKDVVEEVKKLIPETTNNNVSETKAAPKLLLIEKIEPKIDKMTQAIIKQATVSENNKDIEKISEVIKTSEPKIQELDRLVEDALRAKGQIDRAMSHSEINSNLAKAKENGQTITNVKLLLMTINTGYCRIISAVENIFGKALSILKKVLMILKDDKFTKPIISAINFREDFYNSFKNVLLDMSKMTKGGTAFSYKAAYSQMQKLFNDKFLNSITHENFKKVDFSRLYGNWKQEEFNRQGSQADVVFKNIATEVEKVFKKQTQVVNDLNKKDNYSKLTYIYNITATPELKNLVSNFDSSNQ